MNKLYTTNGCPKCNLAQALLKQAGIQFEVSTDVEEAQSLGIREAPTLVMETGEKLNMGAIIKLHKEKRKI